MFKTGENEGISGVRRWSLSDELTRQVLSLIRSKNLGPGDRLPSVRALAERSSVATPTMREALRRLQANGVVQMRHGSGVYVRNGQERIVLANPNHGELEPGTILDLLESRLLIEPQLTALAAESVNDSQLAEIEQHLEEAERCLGGEDDDELHRANMDFHRAIANFSGNSVLSQILEALIELYSFEQRVILTIYDDRSRDHREHREILAAIRSGNAERARELMRQHLQGVRSIIEAKLAEDDRER